MNWSQLIIDMRSRGLTLQEIANKCGFASRGHVLDLQRGTQQSVRWEVGDRLIKLARKSRRAGK